MIEINLLPPEYRKADATPLPRLATIILGVLCATLGLVFVASYALMEIPNTQALIKQATGEKTGLEERAKRVDELKKQVAEVGDRLAALDTLSYNRIHWAALLDKLSQAVDETTGITFRKLRIEIDNTAIPVAPGGAPGAPQAGNAAQQGKRYKISIDGYAGGETSAEPSDKIKTLIDKLWKYMTAANILPPVTPVGAPAGAPATGENPEHKLPVGYNEELGLKIVDIACPSQKLKEGNPVTAPSKEPFQPQIPSVVYDFQLVIRIQLPPPQPDSSQQQGATPPK